jgi:protein gp37
MPTNIEWTRNPDGTKGKTWNPITGCSAVSPGCDNCYAARDAAGRLQHHPAYKGLTVRPAGGPAAFTGEIRLHPDRLDQPLRWGTPSMVFVNSMSDLFHPDVPVGFIQRIWDVMAKAERHTFQILTKRPQRMNDLIRCVEPSCDLPDGPIWTTRAGVPLPNVWLGTSIESDRYTFRADSLRVTPAAVRFLSLEPLLGPLPSLDLTGIDWVIVGGESGPGARPMHPDWARDIRDRCVAAGVPFFFKQWGEFSPARHDEAWQVGSEFWPIWRYGKKRAGRELDDRTWDEMPAVAR